MVIPFSMGTLPLTLPFTQCFGELGILWLTLTDVAEKNSKTNNSNFCLKSLSLIRMAKTRQGLDVKGTQACTGTLRIRIRGSAPLTYGIRNRLFSSVVDKQLTKKFCCLPYFLWRYLWYIYISLQRQKVKKKSQKSRNQGFSYIFCLLIQIHTDPYPSGPKTSYGSGSLTLGRSWPKSVQMTVQVLRIKSGAAKSLPKRAIKSNTGSRRFG
jgi:hypothetical protein